MKKILSWIFPTVLMVILASCDISDLGMFEDNKEITVKVYQDEEVKLSHTVDNSGTPLNTVIHSEHGDITKSYNYDEAGSLSLINRTNPLGEMSQTYISSKSFQTRSGKIKSVTKTFTTSGTRSTSIAETIKYNFKYSASDELTEIVKEYGHGCIETKNTEEDAKKMAKMLKSGLHRSPASQASKEYSEGILPDWVKEAQENPETIKPYFENIELNIRGDVVDFRANGIRENIVKGKTVTRGYLDLKVGDVFIDSDEISRKIVRIEEEDNTYKIYTASPEMTDTFYGGRIPRQTVMITTAQNIVDGYVPEGTETRSAGTRGFSTGFEMTLWEQKDNKLTLDFSADLGVAVSCDVDLGSPGWFRWNDGFAYAYFHPNIKMGGGFTAAFSIDNTESFEKIPLYGFKVGVADLGLYAAPLMEGSLSAYVKTGVEFGGYIGGRCVLDPWPEDVSAVNQLQYGFYGEAGLAANAVFKPKLLVYGKVSLLGYKVVEIDPGGGFYAELNGEISGGFSWHNVNGANLYWNSEGSAELGLFLDSSLEVANKWKWTLFAWKYPLYKFDAWSTENQKRWKEMPSKGLASATAYRYVDASTDGTVVAVNNNRPYILNADRSGWTELGTNYGTNVITVQDRNNIFRLDSNGYFCKWNGHSWDQYNSRLQHIDARPNGVNDSIRAVGLDTRFYVGFGNYFQQLRGSSMKQVAYGANGKNYCTTGDAFYWRDGDWRSFMMNRNMIAVSAGVNDICYGVDKYGSVFDISRGMKRYFGVTAKIIAYANDDNLYVIGNDGKCYHWTDK